MTKLQILKAALQKPLLFSFLQLFFLFMACGFIHTFIEVHKNQTSCHALKIETAIANFVSMQLFSYLLKSELLSGKKWSIHPVMERFAKNEQLFDVWFFSFFYVLWRIICKVTVYLQGSLY